MQSGISINEGCVRNRIPTVGPLIVSTGKVVSRYIPSTSLSFLTILEGLEFIFLEIWRDTPVPLSLNDLPLPELPSSTTMEISLNWATGKATYD